MVFFLLDSGTFNHSGVTACINSAGFKHPNVNITFPSLNIVDIEFISGRDKISDSMNVISAHLRNSVFI